MASTSTFSQQLHTYHYQNSLRKCICTHCIISILPAVTLHSPHHQHFFSDYTCTHSIIVSILSGTASAHVAWSSVFSWHLHVALSSMFSLSLVVYKLHHHQHSLSNQTAMYCIISLLPITTPPHLGSSAFCQQPHYHTLHHQHSANNHRHILHHQHSVNNHTSTHCEKGVGYILLEHFIRVKSIFMGFQALHLLPIIFKDL